MLVLINPNNPDGGYITIDEISYLLKELDFVPHIILDESFIHFSFESENFDFQSCASYFKKIPNLVIVKSMSKDFGIAGIRAGYAIMKSEMVDILLKDGYLWNSNGIAEYFFGLYSREDFLKEYNKIRISYISKAQKFFNNLKNLSDLKIIPSKSNFCLVEVMNNETSFDYMSKLLVEYGIYVRDCSDKIGLDGQYLRIAARTESENEYIFNSLKAL